MALYFIFCICTSVKKKKKKKTVTRFSMERTDIFDVIHFIAFIVVAIKAGYWL